MNSNNLSPPDRDNSVSQPDRTTSSPTAPVVADDTLGHGGRHAQRGLGRGGHGAGHGEAQHKIEPKKKKKANSLSSLFHIRRMPWWLVFLTGMYLLVKLQGVYDSNCAVLGLWSPVSRRDVTKAYRKVSMCTHPDKLLNPADKKLGEILFTRATKAREEIKQLSSKVSVRYQPRFGKHLPCLSIDFYLHEYTYTRIHTHTT